MMENVIVGTDIMPVATHLTTSILSSAHPTEQFTNTNIITLKYGEGTSTAGKDLFIGALDYMVKGKEAIPIFPTEQAHHSGTDGDIEKPVDLPHSSFDLVIMNPPFTRSTGQEAEKVGVPVPAFAGLATSEEAQREMSKKLQRIQKQLDESVGHQNAGTATNFMDLAHLKVKDGGVVGLVVLATFVSGKSWSKMRELLRKRYRDVLVISIASGGSFSADTSLAEVLIVATRENEESKCKMPITSITIKERPGTIIEAIEIAKQIAKASKEEEMQGLLHLGNQRVGHYRKSHSFGDAGVKNTAVSDAAIKLGEGILHLTERSKDIAIPVVQLGQLGTRGPHHQDIDGRIPNKQGFCRGPFKRVALEPDDLPEYPILWAHGAKLERECRMIVKPDQQGELRSGQEKQGQELWKKHSSRLCFNRDFGLGSQSLGACLAPEPVLGGRAWPSFKCHDNRFEVPLVLWMNTTLGLLSFWWTGTRQQQGRPQITVSSLPSLPVFDMRELSEKELEKARAIFDKFSSKKLLPANKACDDDIRKQLDRAVLIDLLGRWTRGMNADDIMNSLEKISEKWCEEPSVRRPLTTRKKKGQ